MEGEFVNRSFLPHLGGHAEAGGRWEEEMVMPAVHEETLIPDDAKAPHSCRSHGYSLNRERGPVCFPLRNKSSDLSKQLRRRCM